MSLIVKTSNPVGFSLTVTFFFSRFIFLLSSSCFEEELGVSEAPGKALLRLTWGWTVEGILHARRGSRGGRWSLWGCQERDSCATRRDTGSLFAPAAPPTSVGSIIERRIKIQIMHKIDERKKYI